MQKCSCCAPYYPVQRQLLQVLLLLLQLPFPITYTHVPYRSGLCGTRSAQQNDNMSPAGAEDENMTSPRRKGFHCGMYEHRRSGDGVIRSLIRGSNSTAASPPSSEII